MWEELRTTFLPSSKSSAFRPNFNGHEPFDARTDRVAG
jgi:hypothetical protein